MFERGAIQRYQMLINLMGGEISCYCFLICRDVELKIRFDDVINDEECPVPYTRQNPMSACGFAMASPPGIIIVHLPTFSI